MPKTRRDFIRLTAAAGGVVGLGLAPKLARATPAPARKPLNILILGGTGFIGPHHVEYAIKRGHKVTLFNRGKTNPNLFPEAEKLEGDRDGKLDALKGRTWDAVIDNSGYVPRHVRDSATLLKGKVKRYLFVSTLSVFADFSRKGIDEDAPLAPLTEPGSEDSRKHYGPLKALCEQEVRNAFGDGATIVRPGLIVGPGDTTDRFTYWPVRIAKGGEILAPGDPNDHVLIIDARDLCEWCVHLVENDVGGTYNAVGPKAPLSMAEMLYGIRAVTTKPTTFTWVPAEFLEQQKVRPWADMPTWFPPKGPMAGFGSFSRDRAIAKGLVFRPLADTARDTLDWFATLPADRQATLKAGISAEREAAVLAAWHAAQK
ncbi:MAG: NAD-dependent epimerase/dehydratase family protein [Gemmatimonadales bacterium]|nr:NAD-dependent epimerase/dehydratase family protein [Gemmatimonadales bacterium]